MMAEDKGPCAVISQTLAPLPPARLLGEDRDDEGDPKLSKELVTMSARKSSAVASCHSKAASPNREAPTITTALLESQTHALSEDRRLGVGGVMFLIFNKVIGTGIFSTPSTVFAATGSVGLCLVLWLAGGLIALCGLSVFLEFGMAIPRSGGPKNYVERVYRRPRYLASCLVAAYSVLLGFSSANSLSFGRYILRAVTGAKEDGWQARAVAIAVITFAVIHSIMPRWGVRLSNVLGTFKIVTLLFIVFSGFAALTGLRHVPNPHNFDHVFDFVGGGGGGGGGGGAYAFSQALLNVIYSYSGWESSTYVMGEFKRPGKTLAIAAPTAIACVSVLYLLANVAYFTVIPKPQLAASKVLVADVFFRNMFGEGAAARMLPALVALSNLGNILATSFTVSRITQELAKEGLLPFSRFWASNRPFNTPTTSFFLHWLVTVIVLVAPPPGPVYTLIINSTSYATAWINLSVVAGLIWLQHRKSEQWTSPWTTCLPVSLVFLAANLLLVTAPLMPPKKSLKQGEYPYYVFPLIGVGTFSVAALYWLLWREIISYFSGQRLVSERTFDENGVEVIRYHKLSSAPRPPPP